MRAAYQERMFYFGATVAVLILAFSMVASGQERTIELPIEDAVNVRSFAQLVPAEFSPDGKEYAYTIQDHQRQRAVARKSFATTGVPPWSIGCNIFVLGPTADNSRNITGGAGNNWLPTWSPDGRYLAFLSDREQNDYARLWIWDAAKDELRRVSDAKINASEMFWTPDSQDIIVSVFPQQTIFPKIVQKQQLPVEEGAGSTVTLYGSPGASFDREKPNSDPWDLDLLFQRDLVAVKVSDGSSVSIVKGGRVARYQLSPDGSHIAYTIPTRFEKAGSQQILFDLAVVALRTREVRVLASDIRLDYEGAAFNWSPDGLRLAFRKGGSEEKSADCYIVRRDGGRAQNVSGFAPSEARPTSRAGVPFWDAKGSTVYFVRDGALWRAAVGGSRAEKLVEIPGRRIVRLITRTRNLLWTSVRGNAIVITHDDVGKQDGFYEVDLTRGTSSKLMEKGQCYTCVQMYDWQFSDVSSDGQRLAFYAEDAQHGPGLWIGDPSFLAIKHVSHLNPQFDRVVMGSARLIEWRSSDGDSLKGALLLPSNYEKGRRYPLIVWVYGGRLLSNQVDHFGLGSEGPFNMQIFATRGYAVLMPDAPQHMGTPMVDLAKTVLPGVDKVIEVGIADPERLGIMGHSYGSYSTLSLIVQTKRFKAALAVDGLGDLVSAYGQMDAQGSAYQTSIMETGQGLMGGPPWEFPQRYIQNSPLFYLDRVDTPLFIVHGEQDSAVASFLADELFVGLRRLGKTVLYAKYHGEDHTPLSWSHENQIDFSNRMVSWFNQYLTTEPGAQTITTGEKSHTTR